MIFRIENRDVVKCRMRSENSVIVGIYDRSYFKDIFTKERLKEYF
jgi:hypothetical protein